jgi:anaphase-promoting complex subunit 3
MALKGNLPEKASLSFRQALALNPLLWEAFEGLCALGKSVLVLGRFPLFTTMASKASIPEIDELFPPRPPPIKRTLPEEPQQKPVPTTTGVGFFTPDTGNAGNLFRSWKLDPTQPQPFRMGLPIGPRDSM